jgi:hypothetical protein
VTVNERRRLLRVFFVLTAFGVISGFAMLGKPSLEHVRLVDAVQLIGTGMCFGGAIVALGFFFRGPGGS